MANQLYVITCYSAWMQAWWSELSDERQLRIKAAKEQALRELNLLKPSLSSSSKSSKPSKSPLSLQRNSASPSGFTLTRRDASSSSPNSKVFGSLSPIKMKTNINEDARIDAHANGHVNTSMDSFTRAADTNTHTITDPNGNAAFASASVDAKASRRRNASPLPQSPLKVKRGAGGGSARRKDANVGDMDRGLVSYDALDVDDVFAFDSDNEDSFSMDDFRNVNHLNNIGHPSKNTNPPISHARDASRHQNNARSPPLSASSASSPVHRPHQRHNYSHAHELSRSFSHDDEYDHNRGSDYRHQGPDFDSHPNPHQHLDAKNGEWYIKTNAVISNVITQHQEQERESTQPRSPLPASLSRSHASPPNTQAYHGTDADGQSSSNPATTHQKSNANSGGDGRARKYKPRNNSLSMLVARSPNFRSPRRKRDSQLQPSAINEDQGLPSDPARQPHF